MSKQQIIGPCYEREDKVDKQTDEIIKTLNQTIIAMITITITMIMGEITKTEMVTKITSKEMIGMDQTDNSQIGKSD